MRTDAAEDVRKACWEVHPLNPDHSSLPYLQCMHVVEADKGI